MQGFRTWLRRNPARAVPRYFLAVDSIGEGRLVEATVFTQTTRFTYTPASLAGAGGRVIVDVVGQGVTTVTLDYAGGDRILAKTAITGTTLYLYGRDCLGQYDDAGGWLYYLNDATGLVRQGADEDGWVTKAWLFDPDGTVLEGPEGLVSHLVCGGVYDWSTGLIYKDGGYFDPALGIWLALTPLVVVQCWRGRKRKGWWRYPWYAAVALVLVGLGGALVGCGPEPPPVITPTCTDIATAVVNPTYMPTPEPTVTGPCPNVVPIPAGKEGVYQRYYDRGFRFEGEWAESGVDNVLYALMWIENALPGNENTMALIFGIEGGDCFIFGACPGYYPDDTDNVSWPPKHRIDFDIGTPAVEEALHEIGHSADFYLEVHLDLSNTAVWWSETGLIGFGWEKANDGTYYYDDEHKDAPYSMDKPWEDFADTFAAWIMIGNGQSLPSGWRRPSRRRMERLDGAFRILSQGGVR